MWKLANHKQYKVNMTRCCMISEVKLGEVFQAEINGVIGVYLKIADKFLMGHVTTNVLNISSYQNTY